MTSPFHVELLPEMRDEIRSHLDAASLAMLRMTCRQEQREGLAFLGTPKLPSKVLAQVCREQGYYTALMWVLETYPSTTLSSSNSWFSGHHFRVWDMENDLGVNVCLPDGSDDDI